MLSLFVAPLAQAADTPIDPGSFWTSIQSWAQDLLGDWLGWGTDEDSITQSSTTDEPEGTEGDLPPNSPTSFNSGDGATTDDGSVMDPDG